jgi:hypothetical protein
VEDFYSLGGDLCVAVNCRVMAAVSAHGDACQAAWIIVNTINLDMFIDGKFVLRNCWRMLCISLFVCACGPLAKAHQGPPFPIIVDQKVGPCSISVWTDPDIGIGTFFVIVDPLPGGTVPGDLKIDLGIQPVSGRLAEVIYPLQRDNGRGQVQYNGQIQFDRQEFWRVRVSLKSSAGDGEATAQVEATPPGFGRWDLLFYLAPFLLIAVMFYRGIRKKRNAMH